MSLFKANSLMIDATPVLHVQDVKDGDVGGGYVDAINTVYSRDVNKIVYNSIPNATLTISSSFSSGVSGYYPDFSSGSIVNNNSGNHINASHISLPSGDYYCEVITRNGLFANGGTTHFIYDKTNSSDLLHLGHNSNDTSVTTLPKGYNGYFSLSAQTDIDFRTVYYGTLDAQAHNLGTDDFPSTVKVVHLDAKIYKIG